MKTAISVRDNLFEKVENYAKKHKLSRSQVFTEAVEEYLLKRDEQILIDQINAVCAEVDTSLDPFWKKAQARVLEKEEW
jgi:metal-responsive CopG/Arc/MetJ family transcriptional regulator